MEKKLEIIHRMIANGYHMMYGTVEEMAEIFTVEDLEAFEKRFNAWRAREWATMKN